MPSFRQLTNQIDFGGGLNVKTTPALIGDNESPDMQNMVSDEFGASFQRKGISRYNAQAMSEKPVTGLFRGYSKAGVKVLVAVSGTIFYKGTDSTGVMGAEKTGLTSGSDMRFTAMNNLLICTNFTETPFSFDYNTTVADLDKGDATVTPKGKYISNHKDVIILGNCDFNGTTFPSRLFISELRDPNKWNDNGFINIGTDDGGVITALGSLGGNLYVWKTDSIHVITGNDLDPTSPGFDVIVDRVDSNVGCIAPRSLVNIGKGFIFLAQDGIRLFDGANSVVISDKVEKIINSIPAALRDKCAGGYDPDNQWYWFSYEDPNLLPAAKNNSVLIYDLRLSQWYRFRGLNIHVFSAWIGAGDKNELHYGDDNDGFVNELNDDAFLDDLPLEKVIATFESSESWSAGDGGAADTTNFKEGLQGISLTPGAGATETSNADIDKDLAKFTDGFDSETADFIQFKTFHTTRANVKEIKVIFDTDDGDFDTDTFTITLAVGTLTAGDSKFTTHNILKSDFTEAGSPDWKDVTQIKISAEAEAGGGTQVTFDDMRLVDEDRNAIKTNRKTKIFDFDRPEIEKKYIDLYLTALLSADNQFDTEMFFDNGKNTKTNTISRQASDIFITEIGNDRLMKRLRNDLAFVSKIGSIGSGDDQFNNPEGIAIDDTHIYIAEFSNNRVVKRLKSDLSFVNKYGANGSGDDQLSSPKGIAVDDEFIYVCDLGNDRLIKRLKSNLTFISKVAIARANWVAVDEAHLYITDITNSKILKRLKSDLTAVSEIGGTTGTGNDQINNPSGIAVDDEFIYVCDRTNSRVVKRLKSNLSYVSEFGQFGGGDNDLVNPEGIAVDNKFIYICDSGGDRIMKRLKSNLSFADKVGSSGSGDDQFDNPFGIAAENTFTFDFFWNSIKNKRIRMYRQGKNIQFNFFNNNINEEIRLFKIAVSFIPKTLR